MTSPSGETRAPGGILKTLLSSRWWDTRQAYIAMAVGTNRSCRWTVKREDEFDHSKRAIFDLHGKHTHVIAACCIPSRMPYAYW